MHSNTIFYVKNNLCNVQLPYLLSKGMEWRAKMTGKMRDIAFLDVDKFRRDYTHLLRSQVVLSSFPHSHFYSPSSFCFFDQFIYHSPKERITRKPGIDQNHRHSSESN